MDALVKVLGCSELIEILLTMLDPLSIKRLTQSGLVEKKVLKKSLSSKIWAGLIKRSFYGGGGVLVLDDVKDMAAILKFLKLEEPGSFLLPLLHRICESFPSYDGLYFVALNRPGHDAEPRRVSLHGFLLLEEVEGSFGTSIQSIEKIKVGTLEEPHLSVLSSRMMRQGNPVDSIHIHTFRLGGGLQSAQAFCVLLQADWVYVVTLEVTEAIGEEGWRNLAKAIRPGILDSISVTRDGLAQGKREDIKHIWDTGCWFRIYKTLEDLQAANWEAFLVVCNWSQMVQLLDLSEEEFSEEVERQNGSL